MQSAYTNAILGLNEAALRARFDRRNVSTPATPADQIRKITALIEAVGANTDTVAQRGQFVASAMRAVQLVLREATS